jgi:predicted GNAT family acetyltransferase
MRCGVPPGAWTMALMSWHLTEAVDEFLAAAGEFLNAERARNTVVLTVTETRRATGALSPDGTQLFGWWHDDERDAVSGAFLHTPSYPLLLSAMPATAVRALASELADAKQPLTGVNAEEESARAFAAVWRGHTGADVRTGRRMRLFRLGELAWPEPAPDGEARAATRTDRDLVISWFDAFARDVNDPERDHEKEADERLSYGGITLWQVDGAPVSMAGVTRTVGGMVRVGPVYTPPGQRGHGYAAAATATVSKAALSAGISDVVLYTDLANPTSNAIYQRIGYRPVEDRLVLAFG